ncbi:MAG TPA: DUF6580 family putative transport protein [Candidatus Methylacidiphilales bacterium]|nr:DUF6580 family putative transport protein [Candidatus Methylacidiphilales bacterium]
MKRDFYPWQTALVLLLVAVVLRLVGNHFVEALPDISPFMALAFVGAMYFPRSWGWLVTPAALLLTDVAFLGINQRTDGSGQFFSAWTVIALGFAAALYAAASGFGIWIARGKSLGKILAGSVVCSVLFYVATNTYSWLYDSFVVHLSGGYAPTFAGWLQSNTTGLPGYDPAWMFLRNAIAGDLFFAVVLLLVLDRALLFGHSTGKAAPRMA